MGSIIIVVHVCVCVCVGCNNSISINMGGLGALHCEPSLRPCPGCKQVQLFCTYMKKSETNALLDGWILHQDLLIYYDLLALLAALNLISICINTNTHNLSFQVDCGFNTNVDDCYRDRKTRSRPTGFGAAIELEKNDVKFHTCRLWIAAAAAATVDCLITSTKPWFRLACRSLITLLNKELLNAIGTDSYNYFMRSTILLPVSNYLYYMILYRRSLCIHLICVLCVYMHIVGVR